MEVLADGRRPCSGPVRQRRRGGVLRASAGGREDGRRARLVELLDARLALGEVYERLGRYDDAKDEYQQARRLLQGDPIAEARIWLRESWLPERVGNYSLCVRLVNRALKCLDGVDGSEAEELRTGLWGVYASHRYFQGRNREAIAWGLKAAEASDRIGFRQGCAQAYLSLSLAYADTGDLREAERYSEIALTLYEELEQLESQAQVLNNMGTFSYFAGRWDEAVEFWDRSRELRLRTGDAVEAANGTNNVAEVLSDQGHLGEAEPRFREALRVWRAAGFEGGVAYALANLGRVAYRSGRPDEGLPMLREARALFGESGFVAQVLETDTRIAECHLVAHVRKKRLRSPTARWPSSPHAKASVTSGRRYCGRGPTGSRNSARWMKLVARSKKASGRARARGGP